MKYITHSKSIDSEWKIIYCNCQDKKETNEDIVKAIISEFFVGKFSSNDYEPLLSECEIKNDDNVYITRDLDGKSNIWQVSSGELTDMEGFKIPHAYRVRKIGFILDK